METLSRDWIFRSSVFAWIAAAVLILLLIPFVAMQLTAEVRWTPIDFLAMGALLYGCATLFVLVARRVPRSRRRVVAVAVALLFLLAWVELAVGVFLPLGS